MMERNADREGRCVPSVVAQHSEDAAVLQSTRDTLVMSARVRLLHLARFDERIAAHLDGLVVAGDEGWRFCQAELESPTPGKVFAVAAPLILRRQLTQLDSIYALAETVPGARRGLTAAFAWVDKSYLQGTVASLLGSINEMRRTLGIAVCAAHRVDPGKARDVALQDSSATIRARALRATGELGRRDLLPACIDSLNASDESSRFWAAWSAVLLGNRGAALGMLMSLAFKPAAAPTDEQLSAKTRKRAFQLLLLAQDQDKTRADLRELALQPESLRWVIQGAGLAGDVASVSWLIDHMTDQKTSRLAGEAFSLLTGLDLAYLDLDRKPPEIIEAGPNDDPNDPNVDMDPDDGLPWPDPERISRWWRANGSGFVAGTRYFMGAPVTRENCIRVLNEGFQRQRILAAHYLCLLQPGTPLFEWRAPVWRQRAALAALA
jgi:uncharacterized protein (TIGR02270 family)